MILAIIQARMGSTRLPGKVMKEVLGKPLIGYLLERLQHSKLIDKIIVATSVDPINDVLCDYVQNQGFEVFRGPEDDVLKRYYLAASQYHPQAVVRITADCPLIDPQICDRVADIYRKEKVDFVHTGLTFSEGVDCEIFSFKALEEAWRDAYLPSEREHAALYLHNHPELFKKITLENESDDHKYRFTIDEDEDLQVVKAIIEALYRESPNVFGVNSIKDFLDSHPGIFQLNAHVLRNEGLTKSLKQDG